MKNAPHQKPITSNSARNIVVLLVAVIIGAAAITFAVAQNASPANRTPVAGAAEKPAQNMPASSATTKAQSPAAATPTTNAATVESTNPAAVEAAIAQVLQGVVKSKDMPGMAAAVIVNGKILGAGGGGFMLLFAKPEKHAAIRARLKSLVFVSFNFDVSGSQVVLYQPNGL